MVASMAFGKNRPSRVPPLALAVKKATAFSLGETPSVFFEGLNALRLGLF